MGRVVLLVLAVVAALAASPGLAAARKHRAKPKPHCAIPKGWTVAAGDAQAVVIVRSHNPYGTAKTAPRTWRYCLRRTGKFRLLVDEVADTTQVGVLDLAGVFVAYDLFVCQSQCRYGLPDTTIYMRNLATGRVVTSDLGTHLTGNGPPVPSLLLSSDGIAAWLASTEGSPGEPRSSGNVVQTLSAVSRRTTTLDTDSSGGLSNLRLYSCAAGCRTDTAVVAWMHGAIRRYAQVS